MSAFKLPRLRAFSPVLGAVAVFIVIGCIFDNQQASRRGSEVENELGVYGRLVDESGAPLTGATVKVYPEPGSSAASDTDSVLTDDKGEYAFHTLDTGSYDILGDYQKGTLVFLRKGIDVIDTGKDQDLGIDTLRPPGRIHGRLLLGGKGKGAVFCYIPGTSYLAVSDDSGRFTISGVPQGRYAVGYVAAGFLITQDTGVQVISAKTTELPVKHLQYDPAFPPPAPSGLSAVYDTLGERVRLAWDVVPVSDLAGFVIYRDDPSYPEPVPLHNGFTSDTSFIDSAIGTIPGDSSLQVIYLLKARDKGSNVSQNFSPAITVKAVSKALVTTTVVLTADGLPGAKASANDTAVLAAAFSNPTRGLGSIVWMLAGKDDTLRAVKLSGKAGVDTLRTVLGAVGVHKYRAIVTDDAGRATETVFAIEVITDPPVANAGRDTLLSIKDSLMLRATGADHFGRITAWEWAIGESGKAIPSADGSLAIRLPDEPGKVPCVATATDDDGNLTADTLWVTVVRDAPLAFAGPDTILTIKDSLALHGAGTDQYGRIEAWAWAIGDAAATPSADGSLAIRLPDLPGKVPCVLTATDDDGNRFSDTLWVSVLRDAPSAFAGRDTVLTIKDSLALRGAGTDPSGHIIAWAWTIGESGAPIPSSDGSLAIRLPDLPGKVQCVLTATDDDGNPASDTLWVTVLRDAPSADAGRDTVLTIKDSLALRGTGTDHYGRIVAWAWAIGDSVAIPSADGSLAIRLPDVSGKLPCVLTATDDDGNPVSDTLWVTVLRDSPSADAGRDTVLTIKDSLALRGSGSDHFGRIVAWAWAIGDSVAIPSADGSLAIRLPDMPGKLPCVLTTTDDDGNPFSDTLWVTVLRDSPKSDAGLDTVVSPGDSVHLRGAARDSLGAIAAREWDIGLTGTFQASADGSRGFAVAPSDTGVILCAFRAIDDDGNATLDTVAVVIDRDIPVPFAGKDTTVSLGDPVRVRGSATDHFGRIVKWEWDLGGTGIFRASGPDTSFVVPRTAGLNIPCVLRVTDDDGFTAIDTLIASVVKDAPIADAGRDTVVSVHDTVYLRGTARQDFGSIVKWEWKCGTEAFIGGKSTVSRNAGYLTETMSCVLRVTDDDGNIALDTMRLSVVDDYPIAKIDPLRSTVLKAGDTLYVNGKSSHDGFGTIGSYSWQFGDAIDIYNSGEGILRVPYIEAKHVPLRLRISDDDYMVSWDTIYVDIEGASDPAWTLVSDSTPFLGQARAAFESFHGKMWEYEVSSNPGKLVAWSSADGVHWDSLETNGGDISPYYGFKTVVFKDKLWGFGIGEYNSSQVGILWNSVDGENWSLVKADVPVGDLWNISLIVLGDKLCLIRGNTIWSSTDGVQWNLETPGLGNIGIDHAYACGGKAYMVHDNYGGERLYSSANLLDWVEEDRIWSTTNNWEIGKYLPQGQGVAAYGPTRDPLQTIWSTNNCVDWQPSGHVPVSWAWGPFDVTVHESKTWLLEYVTDYNGTVQKVRVWRAP